MAEVLLKTQKTQKQYDEALELINDVLDYARINDAIDAARERGVKLSENSIRYINSLYPVEDPKYALRSLFINHMLMRWGFITPLPYQENVIRIWTNRMDWAGAIRGTGDVLISQLPEPGTKAWDVYANILKEQAESVCTIEYYHQAIAILDTMIKVINTNISRINRFEASLKPSERQKLMAYVASPGYKDFRGIAINPMDFDSNNPIAVLLNEQIQSSNESFNNRVYVEDYIGAVNGLGQTVAGQVEPLLLGYFNHFINDIYVEDGIVIGYKKPERQPLCAKELRSRPFTHARAGKSGKTKKIFGKPLRQNFGRKNLLEPGLFNTPKHKNAFSEPSATANNLNEALSKFYNASERKRASVNTTRNNNAVFRNQRRGRRTRKRSN